jgi:hypothetical protein
VSGKTGQSIVKRSVSSSVDGESVDRDGVGRRSVARGSNARDSVGGDVAGAALVGGRASEPTLEHASGQRLGCVKLHDDFVGPLRHNPHELLERRPRTAISAFEQSPHPPCGLPKVAQLQIAGLLEGNAAERTSQVLNTASGSSSAIPQSPARNA